MERDEEKRKEANKQKEGGRERERDWMSYRITITS